MGQSINVSVIIPAYNAADTIAETLDSVIAQTFPHWEAIVIDDGSTDGTPDIAASFAAKDGRISSLSQLRSGANVARNKGAGLARFEWLLFLDADDWLAPRHLERLVGALSDNPAVGVMCCGWTNIALDGRQNEEPSYPPSGDLFGELTRYCAVTPSACIIRRSLFNEVGGFDPAWQSCQDWDLWLRIARTGAFFGAIDEALTFYRMRPDSVSVNARQVLADGLRLITLGHAPDPRVPNPAPAHRDGEPQNQLPRKRLLHACWVAGLLIGQGDTAEMVFNSLKNDHDLTLNPVDVAQCFLYSIPRTMARTIHDWPAFWPRVEERIDQFLLALEEQSQAQGLARSTRVALEHLILEKARDALPLAIGQTYGLRIEIAEPIIDVIPPGPCDRLAAVIELEGEQLGRLDLPVCDNRVSGYVLADAIAAGFAWPLIGRFFYRHLYPGLRIEQEAGGLAVYRGEVQLASGLAGEQVNAWPQLHDRIGWAVFLQEIWNRPTWPDSAFYDAHTQEENVSVCRAQDGRLEIEVSRELPDVVTGHELNVVVSAGGAALGVVTVPVDGPILRAQALRALLSGATGFELCRAAVREGLLGQSFADPSSLRSRLSQAAGRGIKFPYALETNEREGESCLVLGRRNSNRFGTSASRRASLPAAAWQVLLEAASAAGDPVVWAPQAGRPPELAFYVPELINPEARPAHKKNTGQDRHKITPPAELYDRSYFEALFAHKPDPWQYAGAYGQTRYEQTLSLLPAGQIKRALELACAEGHFTLQLAPRVDQLLAADISQIALDRAAGRNAGLANVQFTRLDISSDPIPGKFDLIVCSEVLYYLKNSKELKAAAKKLSGALTPNGYLLMAHAHQVVDAPDEPGFDWGLAFGAKGIGETFSAIPQLRLVRELRTPLYRIQLFQRQPLLRLPLRRRKPELIEFSQQLAALPPEIRWQGGAPDPINSAVRTYQLPILMYHRVAAHGAPALARYRVTPEAFEQQLCYLRHSGYYSIRLEQWREAAAARRPLPGRAVLITFDDGYRDFLTEAWPLLERYGFSATVFLVADEVGHSNRWDRAHGEEVPLLDWPEIDRLQGMGVEFGSHSASHPRLTTLSPLEITHQGARSRAILERQLATPVTAFAYPFGGEDQVVRHLIGACGYTFGLTCRPGLSSLKDDLLALPRIEVAGTDRFEDFVRKISPEPA